MNSECCFGGACDRSNPWSRFRVVPSKKILLMSHHGACAGPSVQSSIHSMSTVALVVDDSMLIRYAVCHFLEERGFAVESATNGIEALELLTHMQPDLIVTDMQMPKMSGSEFITALKSKPETAVIPVIIVAARASGFDESEKRANFAIYKDIDIDDQLAKALDAVFAKAGKGHASGK